jgi:gamma-glutamyl:cysteine ligase YbdK (ATP-grasp superfamily)
MKNYRKVYESYYGAIPKDSNGRSYEIHHVDGNHDNNDISNLKLVTIEEHYNIHYQQQDWGACHALATRMNQDPSKISELATKSNLQRVANGTHPFSGPNINLKRVADGTHPAKLRMESGTHNFLGKNHPMKIASANGTHHFSHEKRKEWKENNPEKYQELCKNQSKNAVQQIANGTHAGTKVFSTIHICPHCNTQGKGAIMFRHHYDNCKQAK